MMRNLPWTLLCMTLFLATRSQAQQDIHFTQFYELPMLRNPALAGIFNGNVRFTSAYRSQWASVTTPYRTMATGAEVKITRGFSAGDFITTGLQITNDVAGDSRLSRSQFMPVLNYHKLLNEEYGSLLNLAFMGGWVTESFDPTHLRFDDQFVNGSYSATNPTSQTFSRTGFHYFDLSTGISFSSAIGESTKMYAGASLFHILQPALTFMQDNAVHLNRKYGINAGLNTKTGPYSKVTVYADYFTQGGSNLLQAGLLYTYDLDGMSEGSPWSVTGGLVYRHKDAAMAVAKFNNAKFSFGLSYDVNISKLSTASTYRGGLELTFAYIGLWNSENAAASKVQCPTDIW
jgi:type IX secretion system PorP/SprF family membrane protein